MRIAAFLPLLLFPGLLIAQDFLAITEKEGLYASATPETEKLNYTSPDTTAFEVNQVKHSEVKDTAAEPIITEHAVENRPKIKTVTRKGIATWTEHPTAENKNYYYALHQYLPIGTIVTVKNPMNDRTTQVKVVGKLPEQENQNIIILISAAAANRLRVLDKKFIVQLITPVGSH